MCVRPGTKRPARRSGPMRVGSPRAVRYAQLTLAAPVRDRMCRPSAAATAPFTTSSGPLHRISTFPWTRVACAGPGLVIRSSCAGRASVTDHSMQYRQLGRSGLMVSPICLGTMMFGGPTDEADAGRIVAHARAGRGELHRYGERLHGGPLGGDHRPLIAPQRHDWVLATKVATPVGTGPNQGGLSRVHIMKSAEDSLRRLGTDFIDIYYLHKEGPPHAARRSGECARRPRPCRQDPLLRRLEPPGVARRRDLPALRRGGHRPAGGEPALLQRLQPMPETEHLPACAHFGLGVFPTRPWPAGC